MSLFYDADLDYILKNQVVIAIVTTKKLITSFAYRRKYSFIDELPYYSNYNYLYNAIYLSGLLL